VTCPSSAGPDPHIAAVLAAARLGTATGSVGLLLAAAAGLMTPRPPAPAPHPKKPRASGERKPRKRK
jgi:hypothetical protein